MDSTSPRPTPSTPSPHPSDAPELTTARSGTEYMRIPLAEYNRLKLAEKNLALALQRAATAETELANLTSIRTSATTIPLDASSTTIPLDTAKKAQPRGPVSTAADQHAAALTDTPTPGPAITDGALPTDVTDGGDEPVDEDGFPLVKPKRLVNAAAAKREPNLTVQLGGPPPPATHVARATARVLENSIQYGEMYRLAIENTRHEALSQQDPNRLLLPNITPAQVQIALEGVELGMNRKTAFAMAAITTHNYDTIVRRAREQQEPYLTLQSLIEIAEARCEAQLTHNWQLHTAENWQAAQALLVKRFADKWGDKRPVSLNVKDLLQLPPEKLREILGDEIADAIDAEFSVDDEDDDG